MGTVHSIRAPRRRVYRLFTLSAPPEAVATSRGARAVVAIVASLTAFTAWSNAVPAETIQSALARAYESNPQLNAQRAIVRQTDEGVPQALSGYRPTIRANAALGTGYTDFSVGGIPVAGITETVPFGFSPSPSIAHQLHCVYRHQGPEQLQRGRTDRAAVTVQRKDPCSNARCRKSGIRGARNSSG